MWRKFTVCTVHEHGRPGGGCDVSIDQLDGTARYGCQAAFLRFLLPATCRLRRLRSIPSLWQHASLIGRNHASRVGVAPVKFPSPRERGQRILRLADPAASGSCGSELPVRDLRSHPLEDGLHRTTETSARWSEQFQKTSNFVGCLDTIYSSRHNSHFNYPREVLFYISVIEPMKFSITF